MSITLTVLLTRSLSVSTGRLGALAGLNLTGGFRAVVTSKSPHDSEYHFAALEALYRIYVSSVAALPRSPKRER